MAQQEDDMAEQQGSFYNMVETRFGAEAKSALKKYSSLNRKYVLAKTRKWYLIKCDSESVCPKYLNKELRKKYAASPNRELLFSQHIESLLDENKRKILRRSIDETVSTCNELQSELDQLATWISENLPTDIGADYLERQKGYSGRAFESKKEELESKFNRLANTKKNRETRQERWHRMNHGGRRDDSC